MLYWCDRTADVPLSGAMMPLLLTVTDSESDPHQLYKTDIFCNFVCLYTQHMLSLFIVHCHFNPIIDLTLCFNSIWGDDLPYAKHKT